MVLSHKWDVPLSLVPCPWDIPLSLGLPTVDLSQQEHLINNQTPQCKICLVTPLFKHYHWEN